MAAVVIVAASPPPQGPRARSGEAAAAGRHAVEQLAAGDASAARRFAEAALGHDPGARDARFARACLRAAQGDRAGAVDDLDALARAHPLDAEVCLDAALVARSLSKEDAAWEPRADAWFGEAERRAARAPCARTQLVRAAALVALGRLDEADEVLDDLGDPPPEHLDDADALRAALLAARGRDRDACALLRRAMSERGTESLAPLLRALERRSGAATEEALAATARGEMEAARALLREAARARPEDLTAVALLAAILGGVDASADADAEAGRLGDVGPRGAAAALLVAGVLLQRGDAEGALAVFRRAIERAPEDPAAFRGAVVAALAAARPEAAEALCCERLARGDASGLADFLLGVTLEHAGEDVLAAAAFRACLAKDARQWPAADRLAELLLRRDDAAGAAAVCDAALAADPECVPLRLRREIVRVAEGDAAGAARRLAEMAERHPRAASVRLARARALLAAGDRDAAAAQFRACAELDPACVDARLGLVALAATAGTLGALRESLAEESASRPRDPVLRFASAAAAEAAGDVASAEEGYRAALAAAPRFGAAANNLAWLLATRLGRPAEARPFAESAARLLPRNARVLDTRGWVRFLCGDVAAAEPDLARAARALPRRADVAVRHAAAAHALAPPPASVPPTEPPREVPR